MKSRIERFMPGGIPRYVRCYDNGGPATEKGTIDRYTVVYTGRYRHKTGGSQWYVGMSGKPFHPQGFGQRGEYPGHMGPALDRPTYGHLGKKIRFADLPEDCQKLVISDYRDLWDLEKPA